jgi:hypothetical protein
MILYIKVSNQHWRLVLHKTTMTTTILRMRARASIISFLSQTAGMLLNMSMNSNNQNLLTVTGLVEGYGAPRPSTKRSSGSRAAPPILNMEIESCSMFSCSSIHQMHTLTFQFAMRAPQGCHTRQASPLASALPRVNNLSATKPRNLSISRL